jgi:hypothetical protein
MKATRTFRARGEQRSREISCVAKVVRSNAFGADLPPRNAGEDNEEDKMRRAQRENGLTARRGRGFAALKMGPLAMLGNRSLERTLGDWARDLAALVGRCSATAPLNFIRSATYANR